MNASDSDELETRLEEKAAEWLIERSEGFPPGRAEAFLEWCNEDSRHADAVDRVEKTLSLLDEMPLARNEITNRLRAVPAEAVPKPGSALKRAVYWASGCAAACVLGAIAWQAVARIPVVEAHSAPASGPERIALGDGSVLDLNAGSTVQVEFSRAERRVSLTSGEGYFQVAHDEKRPFIVVANGIAVRAVGTAFNVRMATGKVDVMVTEGKVAIDRAESLRWLKKPLVPALSKGERAQVKPNEDGAPPVETVPPEMVHALLSWQDRMTGFTDVPLSEMVARLNRCNTTKIVLGDPALGARRIGGAIDLSQVGAFVRLLEQDGDIVAERRSEGEIVLRHAP